MPLRILWVSDAPWASSGYSVETRLTAPRLAALGHDVALLTTYGLQGAIREWEGLRVYPGGADPFANDVIKQAALDWKADVVITLKDSFVFRPDTFTGLRWCGLTPVDHEPIPQPVVEVCRHMYRPIAYAPNGFREMRAAGFDPLYCPHGYDPGVFYPVDRAQARKALGLPDDIFVVGSVAVNRGGIPSRKAWPQNLEAFALFARQHPDAFYVVHTNMADDGFEGGIPLRPLAARLGILERLIVPDQDTYRRGFPDEYMRLLYNSLDVLNAVSLGEGFGIPQLEAQACGVPIVASEFAAARDLCWGGWHVSAGQRFYDSQGSFVFLPDAGAVAAALENAYAARGDQARRDAALAGAAPYQIERVVTDHWAPALAELEQDIRAMHSRGVLRIVRPEEVYIRRAA